MKRFFVTFVAVVAAQLFLFFLVAVVLASLLGAALMGRGGKAAAIRTGAYLVQEIPTQLPEYIPTTTLPFGHRPLSHTDVLENLEKARADSRIAGVVLKIEMPQVGFAKLDELREQVRLLRQAGKRVYAYATVLTQKDLYLASACDSIYVHPMGMVLLGGLEAERFYLRRLLEKLDVQPQVSQIKEYKAMAEMILREDMSPAARENAQWVLGGLYQQLLDTVVRDRRAERRDVEAWFETSQFDAGEAVAKGIVDGACSWEALERHWNPDGRADRSLSGRDYAEVPRARFGLHGQRIAVVHGNGTITQGENGWVFPLGGTMGDETMVAALREAADDETVAGVLLRLDTPGGLSTASDRIGRMVEQVATRKPVVVSMVDVAASGGYMVAFRCSTLVAGPGSIVGSIGSINMRANITGTLAKLGITVDRVTVGPHAAALSTTVSLTPEEFARLEEVHWRNYQQWVDDVARYRGMSAEQVDAVARGRVFTGQQAHERGLVDEVGGFDVALGQLEAALGIPAGSNVSFLHLPRQRTLLELLAEGEIGGAARELGQAATRGLGLAPTGQGSVDQTLAFWQRCLAPEETLALSWWRF
jgi:protease IV